MSKSFANELKNDSFCHDSFTLPGEMSAQFDIMECLAENDHGSTYLLSSKAEGKRLVLKCCRKSGTEDKTREAELLRSLEHKGLPAFVTEADDGETLFVVREYAEGVPLDQYVSDCGPLDTAQALRIAHALCGILSYLHSRSAPVIHRDIKPSNIIIDPCGNNVMLIDFGISRVHSDSADSDTMYFGTKGFSPPEQYGFSQTDCRTDIYAFGVVLRYMLTGEVNGRIDDKALAGIVEKCTAFSPKDRFQDADAVKKALIRYKKHMREKVLRTILCGLALCAAAAIGFCIGRYTGLFGFQASGSTEEMPYVFTEPLIEKAARLMLQKKDGEPLWRGELKYIREIYLVGDEAAASDNEWHELCNSFFASGKPYGKLSSLADLREMENLTRINLMALTLSDLSQLSESVWLNSLCIKHCNVIDLSPLESLPRLHYLDAFDNQIEDFSVLSGFMALTELGIGQSRLQSIAELGDLQSIEKLSLHLTKITDLEGIGRFRHLSSLSIPETGVEDFSPLNGLASLKELTISRDMEQYLGTLLRDDIKVTVQG